MKSKAWDRFTIFAHSRDTAQPRHTDTQQNAANTRHRVPRKVRGKHEM